MTHPLDITNPSNVVNLRAFRAKKRKEAKPPRKPHPADDLSFMKPRILRGPTGHKRNGGGIDYWTVDSTGSYGTDCDKGRELGREYLTYIGKHPTVGNTTNLGLIVNDMMRRAEVRERGRLTGIEIAFLHIVNEFAMTTARCFAEHGHAIPVAPTTAEVIAAYEAEDDAS